MQDLQKTVAAAKRAALSNSAARIRLQSLFDEGSFEELGAFVKNGSDGVSVLTGHGLVGGMPVYAFAQDKTVRSGAVGAAHGSKIKRLYDLALKTGAPVVGIYDSNGAAIDEGLDAMKAYGEILCWSNNLSGVVPQISVVLGPCIGSASLIAACADFMIMGERAEFFLNAGDAANCTAAVAAKDGVCHMLGTTDEDCIGKTRRLLSILPANNISETPLCAFEEPSAPWEELPSSIDELDFGTLIGKLADKDSFLPLQEQYAPQVKIGFATMLGATVGVVGAAQGGLLTSGSCAKIARFVSICDSFQIPVITLVNVAGFTPSAHHARMGAGVRQIAKLAHIYAEATTPKIALIVGKAYGSAFVALGGSGANADYTLAWPSAVISPLSPQTAVAFLGGDKITKDTPREKVEADYAATVANPFAAAAKGNIDDVVDPAQTRKALLSALEMLLSKRVSRLPKKHGNIPM